MPALRRSNDRAREIFRRCAAIIAARNGRSTGPAAPAAANESPSAPARSASATSWPRCFPRRGSRASIATARAARARSPPCCNDVEAGNVEILIGTQMLTKGHDFPRVTLVGVLNADQGLFGTDPRSHERLAQTILQVAGRAGRADRPGEVVIQTHIPIIRCSSACSTATTRPSRRSRSPSGAKPIGRRSHISPCGTRRRRAAKPRSRSSSTCAHAARREPTPVAVLGPAPLPMERKDGRFRAQLLFRSAERAPLHRLVERTLLAVRHSPAARRARWSLDIDPLEV